MNINISSQETIWPQWFRYAPAIYFFLILAATAHFGEHILQMIQYYILHVKPWGILGQITDREWLHVWYNLPSYLVILIIYLMIKKRAPEAYRTDKAMKTMTLFLWIQGYHLIEHIVKIYQYLATGIEPAPGILGNVVGLVPLHFILVFVTYILTAMIFFQSPVIGYQALK